MLNSISTFRSMFQSGCQSRPPIMEANCHFWPRTNFRLSNVLKLPGSLPDAVSLAIQKESLCADDLAMCRSRCARRMLWQRVMPPYWVSKVIHVAVVAKNAHNKPVLASATMVEASWWKPNWWDGGNWIGVYQEQSLIIWYLYDQRSDVIQVALRHRQAQMK